MNIERVVIWFSAGVTSAVAAKLALNKYAGVYPVHLVNCDTGSEDEDNYRFMRDVSDWLGLPLEIIRSEKYKNTFDVYDNSGGFFKSRYGAPCTTKLKKKPRLKYQNLATDLQIFGYDAKEAHRAERFNHHNPLVMTWFPLIELGIDKNEARQMLLKAGIQEPRTYAEGFNNANCLAAGCVKGGIGYWNHIRKMRPEVFWRMAEKEREIGYALLTQVVDGVSTPVYLDELDPNAGNHQSEAAIQCGLFCGKI
jgi:3'-phosphoadenosine 5'-phosphosulfate sulfotransferase (PAPS reductase)/FAD synthetase